MTLVGWMVYALAVSVLLAVASWMLDAGLSRVGVATRWVWVGALLLSIGVPALAPGMRGPQLASRGDAAVVMPTGGAGGAQASSADVAAPGPFRRVLDWVDGGMDRIDAALDSGASLLSMNEVGEAWMLGLWVVASLAMALVVFGSMMRLRRLAARARAEELLGRRVRTTSDFGPATIGLLDPEIVIPSWAHELSPGELELVLRHEEEHARARDPLLLAIGLMPVLAAPWNPVVWWQLRRLRDAVEVDCDRRVLRAGVGPARYGALLFRLRSGRPPLAVATTMASSPSLLERRLNALRRVRRRAAVPGVIASAAGALVLVAVACGAEPPEAAQETPEVVVDAPAPVQGFVQLDSVPPAGVTERDILYFTIRADGVLAVRRGDNPATQLMRPDQIGGLWRQSTIENPNAVAGVLVGPDAGQHIRTVIETLLREAGPDRIFVTSLHDRPTPPPPPQGQAQLDIARLREAMDRVLTGEVSVEALEAIPAARQSAELRAILRDLVEARTELRTLRDRYNDDYPPIQELLANIEQIETQAVPRVLAGLISSLERRTSGAQ